MTAASLDISSQVDRSEITIGDRIQYEIKVVYPKDGRLELPSVLGNLGSFEVKEYQASDPREADGLLIQTWHFNLSTYTVGKYTIPPQLVEYRHGTDTTAALYYTQPIEINVIRTSPETVKDIADIATLAEVEPQTPWLAYGLAGAAVLIAVLLLWRRFRRKAPPQAAKPALPPFEEAMAKLAGIKDLSLIRQNRAREFCFIQSEALRRYIDRRFGIDSLESTTAEFAAKSRTLPVTQAQKEWLIASSEAADLIKFANAPLLESEASALIARTEEFLRQTRPKEGDGGLPGQGGPAAGESAKTSVRAQPGATTAARQGKAAPGAKPSAGKAAPGPGFTQGGHGHEPEGGGTENRKSGPRNPGGPESGSRGWTA